MLRNNLQYQDEYMFFRFNGIHSREYNVMIQNSMDDFKIITNKNASIDYASPKYQNGRYVMGVTHSHRPISHKLVAYGLTRAEANQVASWLSTGVSGPLVYDYALDWQYNVIVSKLGDMTLYPIDSKHFVVSFDIAFDTIEGTDAKSTQEAMIMLDAFELCENKHLAKSDIAPWYGINNRKKIPNIACYQIVDNTNTNTIESIQVEYTPIPNEENPTEYNCTKCIIPLYIHHLGSGKTIFNVSASVGANGATCTIASTQSSQEASITYSVGDDAITHNDKIIDYKSNNHLFFINNEMPETKEYNLEIKDLQLAYTAQPLSIQSPGSITFCGSGSELTEERIKELTATPYAWFFYGVDDLSSGDEEIEYSPYYTHQSDDKNIFPLSANGKFYYDEDYLSDTDIQYNGEPWDNTSVNSATLKRALNTYKYVYFGFYDRLYIECSPMHNISILATQFTNLLEEEQQ